MSLDITITARKKAICPHCGEAVGFVDLDRIDSEGRVWYPFLESIGYYTPDSPWYGLDMTLTREQGKSLYSFLKKHREIYGSRSLLSFVITALYEENDLVVTADW